MEGSLQMPAEQHPPGPTQEDTVPPAPAIVLQPKPSSSGLPMLALVLLIGVAARVPLAYLNGYAADVNWFMSWTRAVTLDGLGGLYRVTDINYPPFYILVMKLLGEGWRFFDPGLTNSASLAALLRLPACLADVAIALLLFSEGRRLLGPRAGWLAAGLYFLNPAGLYVTAYWGQVDSVHTAFLLAALVACNRRSSSACGFFAAAALLQKLQSIAFLPLFVMEVYRYQRWGGLRRLLAGAGLAVVVVLTPFAVYGSAQQAIERGYAKVVGQYPDRSLYAYNLWTLLDQQDAVDHEPPPWLVRIAADGRAEVPLPAAWYLRFTVRQLSILLFALAVATILTLAARSRRHDLRALAAAALGLAFFTLPTEMHERYAFPVLALLPLWAIAGGGRQLVYWLFTSLFLLNLAGVLKIEPTARIVSGGMMVLLSALMLTLVFEGRRMLRPAAPETLDALNDSAPPRSRLIRAFQVITILFWIAGGVATAAAWQWAQSRPLQPSPDVLYLSDLAPSSASNGWRPLGLDCSVSRSLLQAEGSYYLKGIGTHAPARLTFELPPGFQRFEAKVGVNPNHNGDVECLVRLNGNRAWRRHMKRQEWAELDLPLNGARTLTLEVLPGDTQMHDHVDWCGARLVRAPGAAPEPIQSGPASSTTPFGE